MNTAPKLQLSNYKIVSGLMDSNWVIAEAVARFWNHRRRPLRWVSTKYHPTKRTSSKIQNCKVKLKTIQKIWTVMLNPRYPKMKMKRRRMMRRKSYRLINLIRRLLLGTFRRATLTTSTTLHHHHPSNPNTLAPSFLQCNR